MSLFSTTLTVTGLATTVIGLPNTDVYTVNVTLQLPTIVPTATQGPGGGAGTGTGGGPQISSQVVTVIKHNSTTVYTSAAGDRGATVGFAATAGDTMSVILSSSLAQDEQINAVQATIAVYEGTEVA